MLCNLLTDFITKYEDIDQYCPEAIKLVSREEKKTFSETWVDLLLFTLCNN